MQMYGIDIFSEHLDVYSQDQAAKQLVSFLRLAPIIELAVTFIKSRKYDMVIANINRNILLQDIHVYVSCLNDSSILLLSGFYKEDMIVIRNKGEEFSSKFAENM